jgi:hypothetical protein
MQPLPMLDVVFQAQQSNKFLEYETTVSRWHFDKCGIVNRLLRSKVHLAKLRDRLPDLRTKFELYQTLTEKEIQRGNHLEALAFYYAFTLRPLVEILRIQYAPLHYNFYTRYLYYELPVDVVRDLEALYFISSPQEIGARRQQAEAWFYRTLDRLKETL